MRVIAILLLLGLSFACSSTQTVPVTADVGEATATSGVDAEGGPGDDRIEELYQRFQTILTERLEKANAEVSDVSGEMQRNFLLRGAQTLVNDDASSEEIKKAEGDVLLLADALIENATPTPSGRHIGEGTSSEAFRKLCPLYPFC